MLPDCQICCVTCVSDVGTGLMKNDEVSNVTVSPGQSLLLRCRIEEYVPHPVWENGRQIMNASAWTCSSKVKREVQ